MIKLSPLIATFALLFFIPKSWAEATLSSTEVAARGLAAVVNIYTFEGDTSLALGSGFFFTAAGHIATNRHVIQSADRVEVHLPSGEILRDVHFVADDASRDLAILWVPKHFGAHLPVENDASIQIGERLFVIGNPMGLENTFSDGLLSARRQIEGVAFLQFTAPISSGSSGGPVMNAKGAVIGVTTSTMTEGQNLNLAVPARYLLDLSARGSTPVPFSRIQPLQPVDEPIADAETATEKSSEPMPEWQRVLLAEVQAVEEAALEAGSEATHEIWYETLDHDDTATISFEFDHVGDNILVIGVCDSDCSDLDISVQGKDGKSLAADTFQDDRPLVRFRVPKSLEVEVTVHMAACAAAPCGYAVQTFRTP